MSTPLDYAISFGCTESIRLLAKIGVRFDMEWNLFIETDSLDPDVSKAVLDIVLERLRQLLEFGKQNLPEEIFSSLHIAGFESFHSKARALLNCLHARDIQLPVVFENTFNIYFDEPKDFWLLFGGLFHQTNICPGTARAFFQVGFTDVDS
jgi:hypothetical protein